jgi:hypothetical protein
MSQFFHALAYSPNMSPIANVLYFWIDVNIQTLRTAIEEEWDSIPLYVKAMSRCIRQMVVTPDTDWFSDLRPFLFFKVCVTSRCLSVFPIT